jgi:hypothetical protein
MQTVAGSKDVAESLLIDRPEITVWRAKFLGEIEKFRSEERNSILWYKFIRKPLKNARRI